MPDVTGILMVIHEVSASFAAGETNRSREMRGMVKEVCQAEQSP